MADLTMQIEAALEKGRIADSIEPRATAAKFDVERNLIVVVLGNGASFEFPPSLAEGLEGASNAQLEKVEILGNGSALHWEPLDADFSVPNLLNGIFGTSKWIAARAGSKRTPRKAAAARENGAKGGRPSQAETRSRIKAIAEIVGRDPVQRKDMISSVWEHIRKNNLANPQNKREIVADDKLKAVFGKDRLTLNEIGRKLANMSVESTKSSAKSSRARHVVRRASGRTSDGKKSA